MSGYALIFWIAFLIWVVPEWIGVWTKRAKDNAVKRDRGSKAVLIGLLWVGLFFAFRFAQFPSFTYVWHRSLWFFIGIVIMLVGVILRAYAIRVLGRYFTQDVMIRPDQQVIQTGPYRYIRHPSYSGTLIVMLGIGIAMTNWLSLIVLMACAFIGHLYRVRVEEKALCEGIGQPYVDYMRRTKRFIPFIL